MEWDNKRERGGSVGCIYVWLAEDASSAAMDYRKGDVEEGVVNQAGGGGGGRKGVILRDV